MNIQETNASKTFCGLVLIDKPAGMTSHKVVSILRKTLNIDKVGHLGTLDPFATGLLPVLLGGATRLTDEIMDGKKQYLFTVTLGQETDTLDGTGRVIEEKEVPEQFAELISAELNNFVGEIEQIPPVYSALKMNGKPLYEYMRASGKIPSPIETKKRKIYIEKLELISANSNEKTVTLRVLCGKGTYVRSLARDIAKAIGTVGFCSQLRREYVEPWDVKHAISISDGIDRSELKACIAEQMIPVIQVLPNIPIIQLNEAFLKQISSGNIIFAEKNTDISDLFISNKQFIHSDYFHAFVKIKAFDIMFYSEVKYISELNQFKIMPKKKMY